MIEKLKLLVDGESELVDTIIAKAMKNKRKDTLRRFLVLMNSIIDYYLSRQLERTDEKICFPIIYIPNAPDYTKKVFAEFLVSKLSFFYNNKFKYIRSQERQFVNDDEGGKKHNKFVLSTNEFFKPSLSCFKGKDNHKNLIFCSKEIYSRRKDENRIMAEVYDFDNVLSNTCLTVCQNMTAKDITKILEENKEKGGELNIDNVFVLYTNNDKCKSLSESRLEEWDCGIKNCFIFYFSDYPMRLRHTIGRKDNLRRNYLRPSEKLDKTYKDFITFTEEESRYIFNWKKIDYRHYVEEKYLTNIDEEIREYFKERGEPIKARIHFSLCLDEQRCKEYMSMLKQEEYADIMLKIFKDCLHRHLAFAKQNIVQNIKTFLEDIKHIAIILPFDALQEEKNMFKRLLPTYDINFYNLSDLKYKKAKSKNKNISKTKNKIKETHIINFVYRPHYINKTYPKYPNSFDAYPLNENQQILDIIDGFVFEDMYLWDKYKYEQFERNLIDSTYRKDMLDLFLASQRPTDYDDNIDEYREEEFDDERASTQTVSYKVSFSDGTRPSIIPETAYVIVATGKEKYITKMRELVEYQPTEYSLLKLLDIVQPLEEFMNKKIEEADEERQNIRNCFYGRELINKEEYESSVYIWKILLKHKIDELGEEKVYNDIIPGDKEKKDLTKLSFEKWYDYNDDMILPRKKAHQLCLRDYLGLGKDYLKIMRRIKRKKTKDTKQYNYMEENFLKDVLFQKINEEKFDEIQNSDINEILGFENLEDLTAFKDMLEEEVRPQRVKSIVKQ